MNIIYEDAYLIVVEKEAGIDSQNSRSFDIDLPGLLKNYRLNKKEEAYIDVVHRLDKPVSGIMVFSKKKFVTQDLSKQFNEHSVVKKYLALVCGDIKGAYGEFIDYIYKDKKLNVAKISKANDKSAKKAILNYRLIKSFIIRDNILYKLEKDNYKNEKILSLLEIELKTGRFHQIRVQLSSRNLCIVGDRKYSNDDIYNKELAKSLNEKNIMLYSYYLEFTHPKTKKRMKFILNKYLDKFKINENKILY